jgi:predicted 3-demethylubiquinone-9 3-methyltransferase (glyoxalase superfamily)
MKQAKNTICLWYDGDAEEAARFYAKIFPDSSVGAVHSAPGDFPSGKKGDAQKQRREGSGFTLLTYAYHRLSDHASQANRSLSNGSSRQVSPDAIG